MFFFLTVSNLNNWTYLQHIHKHLELDTHHKLLYVGDPRYQLVKAIEKYFCLIEPVTTIDLGTLTD